jgi:hypothetical protein
MNTWFEIWADTGHTPPYVLIVQSDGTDINVFDPQENRRKVFTARDYDTVRYWLLEDEFEMVRGRAGPEDEQ